MPGQHKAGANDAAEWTRAVYACATDPEVSLPGGRFVEEVRALLGQRADDADTSLDALVEAAAAWSAGQTERFRLLRDGPQSEQPDGDREALLRRTVLGCAPLALLSGAWLQWLSSPGNADTPVALGALALYSSDVGVGHPGASRGGAYLELLRRLRLSEHAVPVGRLVGDPRIGEAAFRLPATLLAMSRRPDDFAGELLGADLCLRTIGLLPPLALVREALPTGADWDAIDPAHARQQGGAPPAEQCRAVIAELLTQSGPQDGSQVAAESERVAHAVRLGFAWTVGALRTWADELHTELDAAKDPAYEMAELMRLRGREGAVYHHQFQLEGRPLSAWLDDCRTDAGPLLGALSRSKLVKPGRSEASSLVRGLIGERGPMFRVFSPEDVQVIRRWIDSLPMAPGAVEGTDGDSTPKVAAAAAVRPGPGSALRPLAEAIEAGPEEGRAPSDLREAYHMLMRRTDTPALRNWAREYVAGWLARARHGMGRNPMALPDVWGHEGLRPWLQTEHDRHGAEFRENAAVPLPSREAVVEDTVQTAPLTLIDGSWLQGFTDYEQAASDIGHSLFETYWDELGNGEMKLNHPVIYREVLKEMEVELPPTESREFAYWPGFADGSFELPVYWLCVGRFPRTFLPEVLGLNLAMELSGVGGTYRRARLALKAHGFSTRFVDIHNTIDNVATGHAAWAADAIDTLLAGLSDAPNTGSRAETWERVRAGYRSLNPPSSLGARRAARRGRAASRRR